MPKTFGLGGVYLYFPYVKSELNICLFSNTYFKITLVTHYFQMAQKIKNLPAMQKALGLITGSGRSPGEGNG